jgi:hypothetical protein
MMMARFIIVTFHYSTRIDTVGSDATLSPSGPFFTLSPSITAVRLDPFCSLESPCTHTSVDPFLLCDGVSTFVSFALLV